MEAGLSCQALHQRYAAGVFREFWWASAMSRMDTRDSLNLIFERGVSGQLRSISPPEEVTTFNLVRRLAFWGAPAIALHSRPLEGGNRSMKPRRPPSGADLELAVEVLPGVWIDLALQAKKADPASGTYRGWKPTQNNSLRLWAMNHGARTPAMLLYNAQSIPPFGPPGARVHQGACCRVVVTVHGWCWPRWSVPDDRSPLAVTLVVLDAHGTQPGPGAPTLFKDPSISQVLPYSMPLECVFCPKKLLSGGKHAIPTLPAPPRWASDLLSAQPDRVSMTSPDSADHAPQDADDLEFLDQAAFSLVMPFSSADAAPDS